MSDSAKGIKELFIEYCNRVESEMKVPQSVFCFILCESMITIEVQSLCESE